jgi:hypothetical protein
MALHQVDGASGEDHPPEMEEDCVHVGHESDVQEAGIDPEGRKETITDSMSASLTPGNVATTRGKRMYLPENGNPHPLANCACHTQPIPKRPRETTPRHTTPVTLTTPATPPPATCLEYLRDLDSCREWSMDPGEQKRRVAFKATCPDRENQWRIQNERNLEMVAQEWMLDIASTNLLRNMSDLSRLNNVTKNIPGISLAAVETADAEQRWRDQNERNLEDLAQAWMLDAAVIKDVRERARLFKKPNPRCLRDLTAIDSGASETMTNNLALVSNPFPADILVRQADGSCVPGQYLRGKLSAKSLGIALPRMDVIYNKKFATTLVSTPQLNRMGMEVILSPTFGSFMQPQGASCPICVPHPDRISFDQDSHGTSLMLSPTNSCAGTRSMTTPQILTPSAKIAVIKDRTDTDTTTNCQETATQTEGVREAMSHATKTKIKLWHARLGGVGFDRLKELGKLYPKLVKIPFTSTFDEVCQCCQRSCMRNCNAAGEISNTIAATSGGNSLRCLRL